MEPSTSFPDSAHLLCPSAFRFVTPARLPGACSEEDELLLLLLLLLPWLRGCVG